MSLGDFLTDSGTSLHLFRRAIRAAPRAGTFSTGILTWSRFWWRFLG